MHHYQRRVSSCRQERACISEDRWGIRGGADANQCVMMHVYSAQYGARNEDTIRTCKVRQKARGTAAAAAAAAPCWAGMT